MSATSDKALRATAASIGYLVLLFAIYFVHVRWFRVDVVLYGALADSVATAVLGAIALRILPALAVFNPFEKLQLLAVWLLLGYVYAISIPTVIDRSLSFYILEKIQQRGGGIREDRFASIFTQEYLRDHHLVAVRLTEQQASGTITISDGCVRLTARGQRMAGFSQFFRRNLLPRHRLLMGEYTDALTKPFELNPEASKDACRQP